MLIRSGEGAATMEQIKPAFENAIKYGNAKMVKRLIDIAPGKYPWGVFMILEQAAKSGSVEVFELISRQCPDSKDMLDYRSCNAISA